MRVAMIVAMARNRVIGRDNKLPWYLPEDLKYFKRTTLGKPIIMGRKTFESIGRPLPGRANIVISSQQQPLHDAMHQVTSVDEALALAAEIAQKDGADEVVVIGGAQIYLACWPYVDRLYLTEVNADVEGDAWFPEFEQSDWSEIHRESFAASDANSYGYNLCTLERKPT
ncbi:MAG: type 3 dihydrofolate reductase [Pseudomonadales bacterium]